MICRVKSGPVPDLPAFSRARPPDRLHYPQPHAPLNLGESVITSVPSDDPYATTSGQHHPRGTATEQVKPPVPPKIPLPGNEPARPASARRTDAPASHPERFESPRPRPSNPFDDISSPPAEHYRYDYLPPLSSVRPPRNARFASASPLGDVRVSPTPRPRGVRFMTEFEQPRVFGSPIGPSGPHPDFEPLRTGFPSPPYTGGPPDNVYQPFQEPFPRRPYPEFNQNMPCAPHADKLFYRPRLWQKMSSKVRQQGYRIAAELRNRRRRA